jgi:branched-chain amino acid transport system substrate-binding protein
VGPDAGPTALRDALLHFKSHAGVNGAYDFEKVPQRGLSDENVVVSRWNAKRNAWDVVSRPTGIPLGH